jgi:hypothetical protein
VDEVAKAVVAPPGFERVEDARGHGSAIVSKSLERYWTGPNGITMGLLLDDGNSLEDYYLSAQIDYAVEQIRRLYPHEIVERANHFVVNKKDWILVRTRGKDAIADRHRVIMLTHLGGIYAQMQFVGLKGELPEMLRYIEMEMRQLSGAKPDDPIVAK